MSAVGAITGIVGLGVTLGALGLAFNLVDKTVGRTIDSVQPRRKRSETRVPRRTIKSSDNIFDLGLTQQPRRSSKKKFRNDNFGNDFNIFAI